MKVSFENIGIAVLPFIFNMLLQLLLNSARRLGDTECVVAQTTFLKIAWRSWKISNDSNPSNHERFILHLGNLIERRGKVLASFKKLKVFCKYLNINSWSIHVAWENRNIIYKLKSKIIYKLFFQILKLRTTGSTEAFLSSFELLHMHVWHLIVKTCFIRFLNDLYSRWLRSAGISCCEF